MANVNGLTQLTNQEAIFEEINEEELEAVVGGGVVGSLLSGIVPPPALEAIKFGLFTILDFLL
ncbi:MAG: bacteriocin [Nostoc sp. ChiQUE02]|uniref:bacteriocin n=1 Tax=Nostoc sp. ChiQUE02 TaxID=3075377 RepID=UPI002AD266B0|nr:bacteriocin [Nostoc sp. ChiQUE02]MDZ8228849.1 bacteriocin [Nostoc sp. ChiQUE02]